MNYSNLFKIAFKSIRNNKMRSFLTMLGIIIGISAVMVMISVGQGAKGSIKGDISSMGSNTMYIMPRSRESSGARMSAADMQSIKMTDYEALVREARYLRAVSPVFTSTGQAVYGNKNASTTIYGVNENYLLIQNFKVRDGIMFGRDATRQMEKVCLVGSSIIDDLFEGDHTKAIGQVIRFNNLTFKIIGTLDRKGSGSMGQDEDNIILTPYTTVQKRILAINYVPYIMCAGIGEEYAAQAVSEVTAIMRQQHDIRDGEKDDFEVMSMDELLDTINGVMDTLTWLLAAIAFISLIVGGIGIMNIMYVSVTERTKEIGLRMSIGAKSYQILLQFLVEAMMISITGGIIGVMTGGALNVLIGFILKLFKTELSLTVQPVAVAVAFLVCTLTGIFFGWYPARKAARLDPIEALRYE